MDQNPPITNQERDLLTSLEYRACFLRGPRYDWRQLNKQGMTGDSCSNCIRYSFFLPFPDRRLSRCKTFAFLWKKNAWSQVKVHIYICSPRPSSQQTPSDYFYTDMYASSQVLFLSKGSTIMHILLALTSHKQTGAQQSGCGSPGCGTTF